MSDRIQNVSDKVRSELLNTLTNSRDHQLRIIRDFSRKNNKLHETELLNSKYITIFLWDIIYFVAAGNYRGNNVSVSDIYLSLGVSKSTAIRCVTMLEHLGILKKDRDPDDRRRAVIALSTAFAIEFDRYVDQMYLRLSDIARIAESC